MGRTRTGGTTSSLASARFSCGDWCKSHRSRRNDLLAASGSPTHGRAIGVTSSLPSRGTRGP